MVARGGLMDISGIGNSRQGADVVMRVIKEQPDFLQWDREINGKLYYALWILFMGGFVLSISYTNQPDLFSNCLIRPLLHLFRLLAVIGSALNFYFQSRAIDAVRHARVFSIQMDLHKALADGNKPDAAKEALDQAEELKRKLIVMDALNSWIERCLIICATLFLACILILTWNIIPTAPPK
jgi:hypothetical protein